jgi:hypothetical protein
MMSTRLRWVLVGAIVGVVTALISTVIAAVQKKKAAKERLVIKDEPVDVKAAFKSYGGIN